MAEEAAVLEVAHVIPGRMRLRWRGSEPLPPELVSRLQEELDVAQAEFRPVTGSLVLVHGGELDVDRIRDIAGQFRIELSRPAPPAPAAPQRREPSTDGMRRNWLLRDLEALLLLGLMATWVRDLVVSRTLRVAPLLLVVLTGLNLYEFWQRRREERCEVRTEDDGQLQLLTG